MAKLSVGWVLSGDRSKASSRLQGHVIHEWLRGRGYSSEVLFEQSGQIPSVASRDFIVAARALLRHPADVVVFEGPEWPMHQLAGILRRSGRHAVGVRCDPIPGPYDASFDVTIVPTKTLATELGIRNYAQIEDAVEVERGQYKGCYARDGKLKVVWVGHPGYQAYITNLVNSLLRDRRIREDFEFILVSQGEFASRQWSEATVVADILSCDVALIAIPQEPWYLTKSTNRLALMMTLGMPIVATLIPSYRELARDGENGFFITDDNEISEKLLMLRDAGLRQSLGMSARKLIGNRYMVDEIALQWLFVLESTARRQIGPLQENWKLSLAAQAFKAACVMRAACCRAGLLSRGVH